MKLGYFLYLVFFGLGIAGMVHHSPNNFVIASGAALFLSGFLYGYIQSSSTKVENIEIEKVDAIEEL